nr:ribosomal protein S18-alanine N-acetyltransferase [Oceanococcus sp. HetDA_MAG_MS8]
MMLRPLQATDRQSIAALEQAAQVFPWTLEHIAAIPSNIDVGWVIESQQQLVAWLAARIIADEAEILNMAVLPSRRQQGLGRQLLHTLLAQADDSGVERVFLEVRHSNRAAQALYRSSGFVQCGLRKDYYRLGPSSREDALLMQRLRSRSG